MGFYYLCQFRAILLLTFLDYLNKMNYPDRTAIDNAEEQLENGKYDPVKSLIQDRAKSHN